MLKIINKGEKLEQVEQAIRLSNKHGIDVVLTFIVGTPGETHSDVMDSVNFVKRFPLNSVSFNNLIPIPGTKVFKMIEEGKGFLVPPKDYLNKPWRKIHNKPLFETDDMTASERMELLRKTKAVKREVIRKKLRRKMEARFGKIAGFLLSILTANRLVVYLLSLISDTNPERFYVRFSKD